MLLAPGYVPEDDALSQNSAVRYDASIHCNRQVYRLMQASRQCMAGHRYVAILCEKIIDAADNSMVLEP